MKSKYSIVTLILLLISMPLLSGMAQNPGIKLKLEKGDRLLYEITIESAQKTATFNRDPQITNAIERTRLHLVVEDIPEPGIYHFSYRKLFTKEQMINGETESSTDSRFPEYGLDIHGVISSYLNAAVYVVELNTNAQTLSISNLDQIRTGLIDYVESRGIQLDQNSRLECDYFTREEGILKDLRIFNFYPRSQDGREWSITHSDENQEFFNLITNSDTSYLIRAEIPEFHTIQLDGVKQKGIRLPRELSVDPLTGILLSAESIPKESQTTNYHFKLELISYSKWDEQTSICGQIEGAIPEEICLEYYSSVVGNDVNHIIAKTKSDGSFSIPLDIENPVRYRMYLLQNFPAGSNPHVNLYVEPGDSIHVSIEQGEGTSLHFTGRGIRNSEFLNRENLRQFMTFTFRSLSPMTAPFYRYLESIDQFRESIVETETLLKSERKGLSPGFYRYLQTEIQFANKMFEILDAWNNQRDEIRSGSLADASIPGIPPPQVPGYDEMNNLEFFTCYVRLYSDFRFQQFYLFNSRRIGYYDIADKLAFSRILLKGYPLYADLVYQLQDLAERPDKEYHSYKYHFEEFLESSNNREANEYVKHLYDQVELLQPGNEMPVMDLMDLDGKKWDWSKTRGKIVVLMLFNEYGSAQNLCEDLYKEYGYNRKDVLILRISPGISYEHWKNSNTRYSGEMQQFYYPEGEDAFNDRFMISSMNNWKFLVIDRNGMILRNPELYNIKTAIKAAVEQPLPPKKPFVETSAARIILGVLLGIILSLGLYRLIIYRRLKQRSLMQKMSELEQRAMKAQLNPHFLFNSLNSIQNHIRANQLRDADNYLSVFATLIRKILDNSDKESVPISEELEIIKRYLELEQMRFEFQYDLETDPEIDIYNTMIPAMMLQPVVENAILHGLAPKTEDRKLTLEIRLRDDAIIFIVKDNGIGRAASSELHHDHDSKGLQIIQSRIDILNRTEPDKYKLEIVDLKDQDQKSVGTQVEISFPDEK
jgi:hypothetical protein